MSSAASGHVLAISNDQACVSSAESQLHPWQKKTYEEKKAYHSQISTIKYDERDGLVIFSSCPPGSTILFLDNEDKSNAGCAHANADTLVTEQDSWGSNLVCPTCESEFSFTTKEIQLSFVPSSQ